MAEDNRTIVYYKGRKYYLVSKDEAVAKLQDITTPTVTKTVEVGNILTLEQFEKLKDSRRSTHVNWIR